MDKRILGIIQGMLESSDFQEVLEKMKLSPGAALRLLGGKRGRREIKARRQMARLHSLMLADRHGPSAVRKLTELLSEGRPELRLKSALAILDISSVSGKGGRRRDGSKAVEPVAAFDAAKTREYMDLIAGLLRAHRAADALDRERAAADRERLPSGE